MITSAFRQIGGAVSKINGGPLTLDSLTTTQLFITVVLTVGILMVVFLLNQWIWNNVLAKYVTVINPIPNLWEFILISYLIMSFHRQ